MKNHGGVWLPDHEHHLCEWMSQRNRWVDGKLTYQYHKLEAALPWVKQWRVAVDVGAHVGLWSMHLVKRFAHVHAFEPVAEHRDCFAVNVPAGGHTLHACALGEVPAMVNIHVPQGSSGGSHVLGTGGVPMIALDSLGLADVDFLKVDCEGYELLVLRGAAETLKRCRPCVVVEQKVGPKFNGRYGFPAHAGNDFLRSLGAHNRTAISGDYVFSWD